jgi:hypothetical protein
LLDRFHEEFVDVGDLETSAWIAIAATEKLARGRVSVLPS